MEQTHTTTYLQDHIQILLIKYTPIYKSHIKDTQLSLSLPLSSLISPVRARGNEHD